MSFLNEQGVEHIIPVSLQMDEPTNFINEDDSPSESSDMPHTDPDLKPKGGYNQQGSAFGHNLGFYHGPSSWTQVSSSGRHYPQQTPLNLYHPLPPTINIFACPPPPPPYVNGCQSIVRPKIVSGYNSIQVPGSSFPSIPNILPTSSACVGDNQTQSRASDMSTPPPPELTTPFHCEDSKTNIQHNAYSSTKSKNTRYHPYREPPSEITRHASKSECDNRSFLLVDAQDFSASEISVKVVDKKLTVEGTKPSNHKGGRFVSMRQEFTFRTQSEAKNTSCSFHPNGTLILHFKQESGYTEQSSDDHCISNNSLPEQS